MMGIAWFVDVKRHSRADFAFWLHLFGLMAFWGGLTFAESSSEFGKAMYCLVNVGLILLSVFLMRRAYAVFGAIGVAIYLGHLASRVFEDSLLFPFALSFIGLGIIGAGLALHRNRPETARPGWPIALPAPLKRLRPLLAGGAAEIGARMSTIRLTMAQAMVRLPRRAEDRDRRRDPAALWRRLGDLRPRQCGRHGRGAAWHARQLPTYRAHNEQGMAHAAIAFAKASRRRRMMACTTSIGPGATNMVTAAAVAHVNRLPVLLLPGDVFANRRPDPVLQQIEDFSDGTVSANDCFRPVSRYFDRITRPEQIIPALQRAMSVLTDPAECGPVTLALCQDTQAEAYDYPESFFAEKSGRRAASVRTRANWRRRRRMLQERQEAVHRRGRRRVVFRAPRRCWRNSPTRHGIPVGETQAGKSSLPHDHAPISVRSASPERRRRMRLPKRPTWCWRSARGCRISPPARGRCSRTRIAASSVSMSRLSTPTKHNALPLVADARAGLEELGRAIRGWKAPDAWTAQCARCENALVRRSRRATPIRPMRNCRPTRRSSARCSASLSDRTWSCARQAGFRASCTSIGRRRTALGYHMEYGYSCMGYEIAGGLGVKMADPVARSHRDGGRRLLSDDEFRDSPPR